MTLVFFGRPWDAPAFDGNIVRVATPVGSACIHCTDVIRLGDRGYIRALLERPLESDDFDRPPQPTALPIHRECEMAMVVGPLAHVQGRCSQSSQCVELMATEGRSIRQDSLAAWEWVHTMGIWTPHQLEQVTDLVVEELTGDPRRRRRKRKDR